MITKKDKTSNLNSIQWHVSRTDCSNYVNYESRNINSQLELYKLLDVRIH
jgi:hypothetical protein